MVNADRSCTTVRKLKAPSKAHHCRENQKFVVQGVLELRGFMRSVRWERKFVSQRTINGPYLWRQHPLNGRNPTLLRCQECPHLRRNPLLRQCMPRQYRRQRTTMVLLVETEQHSPSPDDPPASFFVTARRDPNLIDIPLHKCVPLPTSR